MVSIRGITTCVGYASYLAVTLYRNMRHMRECLVVTSPEDHETIELCRSIPSVRVHITDGFTRSGAHFNKGLAMEEGFTVLGRHGWILVWDADCLFPNTIPYARIRPGSLHGSRRRLLDDLASWDTSVPWGRYRTSPDGGPIGFFQLFHADDPVLADWEHKPWYDVSFTHAGGGDAFFMTHWPPQRRIILPMEVLHFGPSNTHWFGTDDHAKDIMTAFVIRNGWTRARPNLDFTAHERVGEITERVEIPGYPPSKFELPFVRRSRERKQQSTLRHP